MAIAKERRNNMKLSNQMQQLIELMKRHFKEEAQMDVVSTTFGNVTSLTLVENAESGKYGVIFLANWEAENLKEGVDVEKLAAELKFTRGYRLKDLL